ncbi:flavin reductase family protein [Mumia sp.]|uniref:flavin reductase family protein n=1 Tax=Mumia sp. TaxID=1965300 RepID=UPI00344DCBA1
MSHVAAAVSVVTVLEDGVPHGTTVSAFMSLSMEPPMMLVSLDARSSLLTRVRLGSRLGGNVLVPGARLGGRDRHDAPPLAHLLAPRLRHPRVIEDRTGLDTDGDGAPLVRSTRGTVGPRFNASAPTAACEPRSVPRGQRSRPSHRQRPRSGCGTGR